MTEPRASSAIAVGRGVECRSAGMANMRSEVRTATTDPAAGEMRCRMSRKMSAATAEARTAAATTKMGTTAATAMSATATAAMSATATAAPGISNSRQTKGKAYCGRACCDFPHDMTSSSGPNAGS
jgi:hypothetical protein